MKHFLSFWIIAAVAVVLVSCMQSSQEPVFAPDIKAPPADAVMKEVYDVPADSTVSISERGIKTPARKFLRTAELKFKVREVSDAISYIENQTRAMGGFVNYSSLHNQLMDSMATAYKDSVMQVIRFAREGTLILRVPDDQLDSFLNTLLPRIYFLDKREIRSEDVSIRLLENEWSALRAGRTSARIREATDRNGKKLTDMISAEQAALENKEAEDHNRLAMLRLNDAIRFSTVQITIYQEPLVIYRQVPDENLLKEFQPSFRIQLYNSFGEGWQSIKDLAIYTAKFWSLLVLGIIAYLIFNKYLVYSKKTKAG